VYQLMRKYSLNREAATRRYLEESDERLYNPKAVYLFPGEEYIAETEEDDQELDLGAQNVFGRVEYRKTEYVIEEPVDEVEQRMIGAKKDPDQEALEHAMLLSAQEDQFGINMYDSLSSQDHLLLEDYISQGFTREEAALIIFEEKFGKSSNTSTIIPAMPTLNPVRNVNYGGPRSHHSNDMYGSTRDSDEEDNSEVMELIRRGYTREQALAVIEQHRERAIARSTAPDRHPTDPTHYDPHPKEEEFNLTEKEEREVEAAMTRSGYSRRVAVDQVVRARTTISSGSAMLASRAGISNDMTGLSITETINTNESYEVRQLLDRGYTREQAQQLIAHRNRENSRMGALDNGSLSHESRGSVGAEVVLPSQVVQYMNNGYSKEQAFELMRRKQSPLVERGNQSENRSGNVSTLQVLRFLFVF
jgi:hypothetical protein